MGWKAAVLLVLLATNIAHAADLQSEGVQLMCHRTANEDVPENTLESLREAALLGCNVVEVDVRRTLDGRLVLQHDGFLERLTDGVGEVEQTYYDDLGLRDAGSWMGDRFQNMRIPLLSDALHLARDLKIQLILDLKDKGLGEDVLQLLRREDMLESTQFGGESEDIKRLYPNASKDNVVWVQPGITAETIKAYHQKSKTVNANFSANGHEMDLIAMKAAVAAGVDSINVDYPRLGADAVGRPVEQRLSALIAQANKGESNTRAQAVLALTQYRSFSFQQEFRHWLLDPDDHVSRAAAIALVKARPRVSVTIFTEALRSQNAYARANAAWALSMLNAPASMVRPLLKDKNPEVLQQTLVALAHMRGEVSAAVLMPLLSNREPAVRGAAAIALAKHQPDIAARVIPVQLRSEIKDMKVLHDAWLKRGKSPLTQVEIDRIVLYYRCQMKEVLALSMSHGTASTQLLEGQAFRPDDDFSQVNGLVAAFQLWDRIGENARPAVQELGSSNSRIADHAEWILVQGGPSVLPDVRQALTSQDALMRRRAIQIVAWQGDLDALPILINMKEADSQDASVIAWAIEKIHALHPAL